MKQVQDTDLRMLRIFVTIADCGGFSAAQSVLNISQSTISEYINRLETRLGVRLCQRGRSGFRLTDSGKQIYAAAQRLLLSVETFRQETDDICGVLRGELRIGLIDNTITNADFRFVSAIRSFNRIAENVRINIEILPPDDLQQRILDGRLHAAVGPFPVKVQGVHYDKLFDELHSVYCGIGHPLFDQNVVTREDLQGSQVVVHSYEHEIDLNILESKRAAAVVENMEAEALLVMTGRYIGFLPKHYARHWVKRRELKPLLEEELQHVSSFYLITKTGIRKTRVLKTFIDFFGGSVRQDLCDSEHLWVKV